MLNVGRKKKIYIYTYIHIYVYMYIHIYIFEVCSVFYRRFYIFKYSKTEILKSTEKAGWRKNFSRDNSRGPLFRLARWLPSRGTLICGRKIFYHTIVNHSIFPFYEEKRHIDDLSPMREWIFRKEEDLHWSHFVISTNLCEYQTRLRLAWLRQRSRNDYIKKREAKEQDKWDRNRAISHAEHIFRERHSLSPKIFFRRRFLLRCFKGGNIFTRSRLVVRDTT